MRLKTLIWLAAQAVKAELFGGEGYEYQELALLVGVHNEKLVQDIYADWVAMKHIFQIGWMALSLVEENMFKTKGRIFIAKYCKSR